MTKSKDKRIIYIEPTIWYYLLALFFPTMFFLVDDSKELVFEKWDKSVNTYTFNLLCLFMFFGVPILMLTLRREISIYKDRIIINHPTIRMQKTYQFVDLIKWNITDIYIPKAGRQIILHLKFKNKRLTFNKIELTSFEVLTTFLETNYKDKKK